MAIPNFRLVIVVSVSKFVVNCTVGRHLFFLDCSDPLFPLLKTSWGDVWACAPEFEDLWNFITKDCFAFKDVVLSSSLGIYIKAWQNVFGECRIQDSFSLFQRWAAVNSLWMRMRSSLDLPLGTGLLNMNSSIWGRQAGLINLRMRRYVLVNKVCFRFRVYSLLIAQKCKLI